MKANEFYMKRNVVCIAGVLAVSACTSVQVNAVAENQVNAIHQICIVNNPKVLVKDFVPVVQSRLQHHGKKNEMGAKDGNGNAYLDRTYAVNWWRITTG